MTDWKNHGEGEAFVVAAQSPVTASDVKSLDIDWSSVEGCHGNAGAIPIWVRALGGTEPRVVKAASSAIFGAIEHQGSVYPATKPTVLALVEMLRDGRVPLEGARNSLRSGLNWKGLFKFVPKADRELISTKTTPIDGVLGFPPEDFVTYREGVREGPFAERLVGGGRAACSYAGGKLSGRYQKWSESGQLVEEGTFEADKRVGLWTEWHPQGTKKSEGAYAHGKKTGPWTHYGVEGRVLGRGVYKEDRRHGDWTDEHGRVTTWKNGAQV